MPDIATVFIDFTQGADLALDGLLLLDDDGLTTAVILSLFTDRQAAADDVLPDEASGDRGGFWGDEFASVAGDRIGSRLWLNQAAKQLPAVLRKDQQYAREALQWLIDDQVVSRIDISAMSPRPGVRRLDINIHRPQQTAVRYQFEDFWNHG